MYSALRLACRIASSTGCAWSSLAISAIATSAPSIANASAIPRPMPRAPPVTMAALPANLLIVLCPASLTAIGYTTLSITFARCSSQLILYNADGKMLTALHLLPPGNQNIFGRGYIETVAHQEERGLMLSRVIARDGVFG